MSRVEDAGTPAPGQDAINAERQALRLLANRGGVDIDLSQIPVTHTSAGGKAAGCFMVFFALIWGGIPTVALITQFMQKGFSPELLPLLIFTVIGTILLAFGIGQFFKHRTVVIDKNGVTVDERSISGARHWRESFQAYQGVLSRSEYHPGGKNRPAYTLYIVELLHADKRRTIRLYESKSPDGQRSRWEDAARILNMPALEYDGDGLVTRKTDDLDKSIGQLVREGKLKSDFDPTKGIPSQLKLQTVGDALHVTVNTRGIHTTPLIVVSILPLTFIILPLLVPHLPKAMMIPGIFFGVALGAVIFSSLTTKSQLRISRDTIRLVQLTRRGDKEIATMRANAIETLRLARVQNSRRMQLEIATDGQRAEVGAGLPREALEWLRSCIIRVLSA